MKFKHAQQEVLFIQLKALCQSLILLPLLIWCDWYIDMLLSDAINFIIRHVPLKAQN